MKYLLSLLLSLPYIAIAEEFKWESLEVNKGYILSLDLEEKECVNIWSKRIPEFKKQNPHIKDPDLLSIGKIISVQNCKPSPVLTSSPILEDYQIFFPYVSVYTGASFLSETSADTKKLGYNMGVKLGYDLKLFGDYLRVGLAAGYLQVNSKTVGESTKGIYEVKSHLYNIEAHVNREVSDKSHVGGLVNLVMGEDVSLKESTDGPKVGAYVGVENLYKLSKKLEMETNLQHRLDDLSRFNFLFNLGLKYNF